MSLHSSAFFDFAFVSVWHVRSRGFAVLSLIAVAVLCSYRFAAAQQGDSSWSEPPTQTLRHPESLETLLRSTDLAELAREVERRGDPKRGGLLFHRSAAACRQCHGVGGDANPLGPDLTKLDAGVTAEHLIESILFPARNIRKEYETVSVLTTDGQVVSGLIARQDDEAVVLRAATDLLSEVRLPREEIEAIRPLPTSLMPDGLIPVIGGQRQFYDLASYVIAVARGGAAAAERWRPSADELAVVNDAENLDHAGIIRSLGRRDFTAGEAIYQGYCHNCHGLDGNTPSLATARAFGTQPLKYGEDPYRMFLTLSRGNGLMAPMTQLTPKERYQVAHYIREQFIRPGKLDATAVDQEYLARLPKGTDSGERVLSVERDYGPALASQLERRIRSALTVRAGEFTVSYDLHTLQLGGVWHDGFLNLDQTQHIRGRGEGTANPAGPLIESLSYWRWGHAQTLDYPTAGLLPRGPLPEDWLDYHGHSLHGDSVVLRYAIDRREILETAQTLTPQEGLPSALVQSLRIGPGGLLLLAVGQLEGFEVVGGWEGDRSADTAVIAKSESDGGSRHLAVGVLGDRAGLRWKLDDQSRLVLEIPQDDRSRVISIVRQAGGQREAAANAAWSRWVKETSAPIVDPGRLLAGGPLRWEEPLATTGYLGLEAGGYALDTLPVPAATPWKTWFRTSAIDFFPDGRMVVTTYGGDVWIVSGVSRDLSELRWKRFASGLYEPMGVKVIDGQICVTGKDRLTRLHDLNADGEADFYESLSADPDVSFNFHAFNFDLQVDSQGFLYYAKSGHGADSALPGVVYKISPDGRYREAYSTGFRTPNGMGRMPGDRMTASDNQGQWMPASKINLLRPGGFYGWVQTYEIPGKWSPDGGKIDPKQVVPPKSFDRPMIWMPQVIDNSSGGQLWVDDPRWGPLSGRLLHTSFGRGWMFYLLPQEVEEVTQAAIIKLPFDFSTGIMRAAVNPADGQVYAVGLDGWNGGGRAGLADHGIQRLRFTGKPYPMVADCRVGSDGLRLGFNFKLDRDKAADPKSYRVRHWNYLWQASYGSEMYSPATGKVGIDPLEVTGVELAEDGHGVLLKIPGLRPVDQLHLILDVADQTGQAFAEEIYWTIHRVPQE